MGHSTLIAGASAVVALCMGLGTAWSVTTGFNIFTTESWRRADVRAKPRNLPDVALQDQTGEPTSLGDLCSKVLVVDFIYTRCNAVCRSQGAITSQLARRLSDQRESAKVLSISFDPKSDGPASLAQFKRIMEPSPTPWMLARPTQIEDTNRLLETFGVVVISDGFGGYDHNSALHVVDRCKLVQVLDTEDIDGAERAVRRLTQGSKV